MSEEQKIIDLENEISFLKNALYEKQKEIEELEDTLKCTQNSWYKDTKLIQKQQKEIEELKQEIAKRQWIHIKENGEVEPLFYIRKDKIREIISKYVDIEEQLTYESNELFGGELTNMIKELLEE